MATAAPSPSQPTTARVMPYFKQFMGMFVAALLSAVLAALFTYYFSLKLNTQSSIQQLYVASVQDFSATGAKVDASITDLADTAIDRDSLDQAKKDARQAIAAHTAATLALRPVIGKGNVEEYMKGLADLRMLVDQTGDVAAAARTSKGRLVLIENRNVIITEARRRIYG